MTDKSNVTPSTGNVFEDLELPNAEELVAKAELIRQIAQLIDERGLTQVETAKLLETSQPKISDLVHGRLAGFSMDRLIRFLRALDRDVDIIVKKKPRTRKRARVRVSAH